MYEYDPYNPYFVYEGVDYEREPDYQRYSNENNYPDVNASYQHQRQVQGGPGKLGNQPPRPPSGGPGGYSPPPPPIKSDGPGYPGASAPPSPPPQFIPQLAVGYGVDTGGLRGCLYRNTYIWLESGRGFWFFPTYIGRRSVAGYRWRESRRRWVYYGIDADEIRSFQCY